MNGSKQYINIYVNINININPVLWLLMIVFTIAVKHLKISLYFKVCYSVVFGSHFWFSFSLSLLDEMLISFSHILVISILDSFSLVLV